MRAQHSRRNDDIEILRAIAVLFTLACHVNTLLAWKGPRAPVLQYLSFWGGVDLFFCISGYVIAKTLLQGGRGHSFREFAVPFYIRRVFRIWPAALAWLILPLLAARYFNHTGTFGNVQADLPATMAAAFQVEDLYAPLCGHTPRTPCGQADVYWSLSLEEQFYILFPLLLYALRPTWLKRALFVVAASQLLLVRPYESLIWSLRTDAIMFGVLLALLESAGRLQRCQQTLRDWPRASFWASFSLLLLVPLISIVPGLRFNAGLLALTSAALVLIASADGGLILSWKPLRPWLLWVGSRSFAIYLVHNPCFRATREIFGRLGLLPSGEVVSWPMLLGGLLLIAVVAELSYRIVEMPLRAWGRKLARGELAAAHGALISGEVPVSLRAP